MRSFVFSYDNKKFKYYVDRLGRKWFELDDIIDTLDLSEKLSYDCYKCFRFSIHDFEAYKEEGSVFLLVSYELLKKIFDVLLDDEHNGFIYYLGTEIINITDPKEFYDECKLFEKNIVDLDSYGLYQMNVLQRVMEYFKVFDHDYYLKCLNKYNSLNKSVTMNAINRRFDSVALNA